MKAQAARLLGEGKGETAISTALDITRHRARALVLELTREATAAEISQTFSGVVPMAGRRVPASLKTVADYTAAITESWQRSVEAIMETGRLLVQAKASLAHGEFLPMIESALPFGARYAQLIMAVAQDERLQIRSTASLLPPSPATLYELTKLDDQSLSKALERGVIRPDMERKQAESLVRGAPIGGPSRFMNRVEPSDSQENFWTPPWATRALMERVLPQLGMHPKGHTDRRIWEPACGEGHMSEVLMEYSELVYASDIHQYGENAVKDFLNDGPQPVAHDWIITNPPFRGDLAERFVLRALDLAYTGVAMFVAMQFLESTGRFDRIFKDRPPTLVSFFAERVNCCKGRWDPDGSTDAAYVWLVWHKDRAPQAPYWIPPGQRKGLTKEDDRAKFAAWSLKTEAAE